MAVTKLDQDAAVKILNCSFNHYIMYVLLKGTITNFLTSLNDFKSRKSELISKYPVGSLIWGLSKKSNLLEDGTKAFLYLNKAENFPGGIILEGEVIEVSKLKENYWPEGKWNYYVVLKVLKIPSSVVNYSDISKWEIVRLDKLRELGLRILPGIQKLDEKLGIKIEKALNELK